MIIIASALIFGGLFFFVIGTLGLIRFPSMITRVHSAAKCDTLGAALSLMGLIIYNGFNIVTLKLILVILFIWITNPTATHLIAKASLRQYEQEDLGMEESVYEDV